MSEERGQPAPRGAPEASERAEPDLPGDPACLLRRVCPACGSVADRDPPTVCPQCHAELTGD
ncbi:MAG: hypothetical protein ACM32E_19680 [Gemmatimonadota bacterium]